MHAGTLSEQKYRLIKPIIREQSGLKKLWESESQLIQYYYRQPCQVMHAWVNSLILLEVHRWWTDTCGHMQFKVVLCITLLNNNGGAPQSTPLFITYAYAAVYDLRHFLASSQPSTTWWFFYWWDRTYTVVHACTALYRITTLTCPLDKKSAICITILPCINIVALSCRVNPLTAWTIDNVH